MKPYFRNFLFVFFAMLFVACEPDEQPKPPPAGDLESISYDPQPYTIEVPDNFPNLPFIEPGSMTVDGVELGRHLFYDPILSADFTQSCSSCHLPAGSFTDNLATSAGIDGVNGTRSSMSLLNIVYNDEALFWDGRAITLEEQALLPVEDPIELHNTWGEVVDRFKAHDTYPEMFRKAFGIKDSEEITKELAAKAIGQFEKTLVSSGQSKFDREKRGEYFFNDDELAGELMFNDQTDETIPEMECAHCHGGELFTTNEFFNNGLDAANSLDDFIDKGLGAVSNDPEDNGRFRAPTLRNIFFTAPYMHDGRFETLEEVIDHYATGGHVSPSIDGLMNDLRNQHNTKPVTEEQKQQLIAFLKTLNDVKFMENPAHQSPF